MSERDELLNVLLDTDEAHKTEGAMWPELATAILAAGYRKPQQVTTVQEVRDLPNDSVLLSSEGGVFQFDFGLWREVGTRDSMGADDIALPATVLHVGGAE